MMEYLGWGMVLLGCAFNILSAFGCIRMSDFYMKLHAAGVADSCGSPMALIGLIIINGFNLLSLKIFILIPLLLVLNPTATTVLINAAIKSNIIPTGLINVNLFKKKSSK